MIAFKILKANNNSAIKMINNNKVDKTVKNLS